MFVKPADKGIASALYDQVMSQIRGNQINLLGLIEAAETLKRQSEGAMILDLYKTWIAWNPADPFLYAAVFNYAMTLSESGDLPGAINALRQAIQLKPDFWAARINLGSALERFGRVDAAVEAWTGVLTPLAAFNGEALDFKTMALKQIGRVLETHHQGAQAEDYLRQSLELDRHQPDVIQHWIAQRLAQCKWPVLTDFAKVTRRDLAASISPLSVASYTDDPIFQLAVAHHYCKTAVGLAPRGGEGLHPVDPRARRPGPLRIGYVSSDLREHAVGFAMTEVIELHDRSRCEIFAYYCGVPSSDATHRRTKAAVDHWHDLTGLSDLQAAQLVRQHEIDILVDLNGYTKDARTGLFAHRPAPVIANWFGFPGSMGSPYHHYVIADETILPPGEEGIVSEEVVRLPCYQPNDRRRVVDPRRPSRAEMGLPEGAFVYCALNGVQKITERVFGRWMTILANVPGSVLWLFTGGDETNARLRERAAARGVAPERLVFAEKMANPQHVARYALADLFVDTFPYGAHTTAADALWMGLPVLTLPGRSFASRVCASLVKAAGIPEMICESGEAYVARAIAYGRDPGSLRPIRERLAAGRDTCLLFDTPRLVRHLEDLYARMAEAAAEGRLPVPRLRGLALCHEVGAGLNLPEMECLTDEAYRALYRESLAPFAACYGGEAVYPACL